MSGSSPRSRSRRGACMNATKTTMSAAHSQSLEIEDAERIGPDPLGASVLAPRFYIDPDVLAAERGAIFLRSWQYLAHESEIPAPGDYVVRELLDQSVVVLRDGRGEVRAFHNVCAHRAHRLLEGKGSARRIVCPYHAWSYHLDGRLSHARGTGGLHGFDPARYGLTAMRVDRIAGLVFADVGGEAPAFDTVRDETAAALATHLPDCAALAVTRVDEGEIACNWKVVIDNCLECYHCQPAHPAFVDLIDMDTYRVAVRDGWIESTGEVRRGDSRAYPVEASAPLQHTWFAWLWPNVQLGVLPGTLNLSVYTVTPITPERSQWRMTHLGPSGADAGNGGNDESARGAYRAETLGAEDLALCESVQRGLHSIGYRRGRFVVDIAAPHIGEHGLHCFQRKVLDALSDPGRDDGR